MNKLFFTLLFLLPELFYAQVISDAKLWTEINIKKKVNDFEFSFSPNVRFDENFTHTDKAFTQFGVEYEVLKNFDVSLGYRFSKDNDYPERNYNIRHRFELTLGYKYKIQNFKLDVRIKNQTKNNHPSENNPTYSRVRFRVKYDMDKDIEPVAFFEFYYQYNDQNIINRNRSSLGVKYKINKDNDITFYYIFENRFNTKNLQHNHIWGISYSIDL